MKKIFSLLATLLVCASSALFAQNQEVKKITDYAGQTVYLTSVGLRLTDSDAHGNSYGNGEDVRATFIDTACQDPNRLTVMVDEFDIKPGDTLFIYDGPNANSPLLYKGSEGNSAMFENFYATGNSLTIRFKSNARDTATGFVLNLICTKPCQPMEMKWDSIFYRIVDGEEIPKKVTYSYDLDSITDTNGTFLGFDTIWFHAFDICFGDRVSIPVVTEYPQNDMYYHQEDELIKFRWSWGDGDTLSRAGANPAQHLFRAVQGYDLFLNALDTNGCQMRKTLTARVRIAKNPIKTIFNLPTICNTSYATIKVGAGNDATIITEPIEFIKEAAKENNTRTFVPDGPNCEVNCYQSPVTFTEFPSGRRIQSANDICAVCINMEHEFMGDIELKINCPEGNTAVLKYKPVQTTDNVTGEIRYPGGGGGGNFFGLPYGGNNHHNPYDGTGGGAYCDSLYNYPGVGWNYCWASNSDYGYWDANGNMDADISNAIYCTNNTTPVTHDFGTTIPPGYLGTATTGPGQQSFSTTDSSHRSEKIGFYKPSTDFSGLVGCSLNGRWEIEVCDTWGSDNGWVFSWAMELCNINTSDWTYNVGIDTVLWSERTPGVKIQTQTSSTAKVTSPDTSGFFLLNVTIIDSFGCEWDTCTGITTVWTPLPNLGPDTALCDDESFLLNADDGRGYKNNYSYTWSPTYETTSTIWTLDAGGNATNYEVEVVNTLDGVRCTNRDTRLVNVAPKPIPNFDIVGLPFIEGCEPLEIKIENKTVGAAKYRWEFGDGHTSTEASPKHIYYAGKYDFNYYATSDKGCIDSIKYSDFVAVYPNPKAKFTWEPETPTVLHPEVQFINLTMPNNSDNMYFWKIQYDKDLPNSVTTLKEAEPLYTFRAFDDQSIAGEYNVSLIALTQNLAPSGNYITCSDTTETTIVLVNDFLQFPNVVTPNGDGINDIFEIKNLVDGLGYPTNELSIFNRWGKRVYHKENISSEDDFWDPAADNSPSGTYFFRFVGKGYLGNIQRNGVIEVLR